MNPFPFRLTKIGSQAKSLFSVIKEKAASQPAFEKLLGQNLNKVELLGLNWFYYSYWDSFELAKPMFKWELHLERPAHTNVQAV